MRILILFFSVLVLGGCAIKRASYDVPTQHLPKRFKNSDISQVASSAKILVAMDLPLTDALTPQRVDELQVAQWWRSFGSVELASLIDRGLANNSDVKIAAIRVAQAQVRANQVQGMRYPALGISVVAGPQGGSNTPAQTPTQASLAASWRLDLWGEMASQADAAKYKVWNAVFDGDNVRRNMAASIASAYIEYLSINDRLKVAFETEKILSEMLLTIERRVDAGDATLMELEQQQAAIFSARALIPNLEQQRDDLLNSIAFLVGAMPGTLALSDSGLDSLNMPVSIPELPSSLLLLRPDVRMAEASLLAADANIDVMRARILPSVDLSAQAGYATSLINSIQPSVFFWNALASVSASFFDGGQREGNLVHAKLMHEEMTEAYVRTIHQAMREVESALLAIRQSSQRATFQDRARFSARKAWDIGVEIYAVGGIDFMTLRDTERTYHHYQNEYYRFKADLYRSYVNLFQSLGGGVSVAAPLPGKGLRPQFDHSVSSALFFAAANPPTDGIVNWTSNVPDLFWQVELFGIYHEQSVDAALRDLRSRYPEQMSGRYLRQRLEARLDGGENGLASWYRLYIARFESALEADSLCRVLQSEQQNCRVLNSQSDDAVVITK